jgi:hypothetical protein
LPGSNRWVGAAGWKTPASRAYWRRQRRVADSDDIGRQGFGSGLFGRGLLSGRDCNQSLSEFGSHRGSGGFRPPRGYEVEMPPQVDRDVPWELVDDVVAGRLD